jgi:putative peptidoglycan lipid II flippase
LRHGAEAGAVDDGTVDRAMARATIVISLFAAVAGASRVAQDAAIAWRYGTGPIVDAYHLTLSLVNWPAAFVLAMLTLLVPPAETSLRREGESAVTLWRGEMLGWTLLVAVLVLPVSWAVVHVLITSNLTGLQASAAALAKSGAPLIVMAVPLGLVGAVMSAWLLVTRGRMLTLLEALPSLAMVALVVLWSDLVLFWGTALAVGIQVLALSCILRSSGALPRPRLSALSPEWRGFRRAALTLLAGQMLFALTPLVDPFFAARLGEGQIATLSYANRLVLGLLSLTGLGLQRAGLPLLSQMMVSEPAKALRTVVRWSMAAAAAGALMGVVVAALADPLVGIIFERGQFTGQSREQVATLLRYGMLQLPPFLVGLVMVTALASERAVGFLAIVTAVGLLTKVVFSALLVPRLGVPGLLLATALMYLATAVTAGYALRLRLASPARTI